MRSCIRCRCVQRRDACHNARACCALAFEGEYTRGAQAVLSLSRDRLSRALVSPSTRRSCTHIRTHTRARTHGVWEYPRVDVGGTGIFPRPAQILLRAGINLLPAFRSRSQTLRAYGGKWALERGDAARERSEIRKGEEGRRVDPRVDLLDSRSRDISGGRYNEIYAVPRGQFRPCLRTNIMHAGPAATAKNCLAGTLRKNARRMRNSFR